MNKDDLFSVEYKPISDNDVIKQQTIIDEKDNNQLSPISLTILDSVITKKVTIIFSQGPFNLSSVISCLYTYNQNEDVLIGIPKNRFNDVYKNNTDIFFSLLYKKKIGGIPSKSFYFYHDVLWCQGSINEETNEMMGMDVSTRPKYGTRKYRNDYDSYINEKLLNGNFQNIPKIVSMPIGDIVPTSVFSEKSISFKKQKYKLNKFNPKLIVYESINERRYNFDNLLHLIENSYNSDVKLVLHFSWPYLKGLSAFLEQIKDFSNINTIHLGKRFCIQSSDNFKKPNSDVIELSLEGKLWNLYYPCKSSIDYRIFLPSLESIDENLSPTDIIFWDWSFDTKLYHIRELLKYENYNKIERNILTYPPIFDSFLTPSETKKSCIINGNWMTLPINDIFSVSTRENNSATSRFQGLCFELEKCRDLAYEFRNLFTTNTISKKTLFQAYLIEKINNILDANHMFEDKNNHLNHILIANLHPFFATQSSFPESIHYLVNSLNNISNKNKLPKLISQDNTIYFKIQSQENRNINEIIFQDGVLQKVNIKKIKQYFLKYHSNLSLNISNSNNILNVTIKTKEPVAYLEYNGENHKINNKFFKELIVYNALIHSNGSFTEKKYSNISFDRKLNNFYINVEIECRTENTRYEFTHELRLLYTPLSKMQELPKEIIQSSELLIPGPVPFNTISDQELLISHGYDAFLLPFNKIIFFAYPGMNFKKILTQINLYNDIISDKENIMSNQDLLFSINHTKKNQRFKLPPRPLNNTKVNISDNDTPIDSLIRQALMDTSNADEYEIDEIKTLQEIWNSLSQNNQLQPRSNSFGCKSPKEQIEFYVEYDDGQIDTISFPIDTLIRKKIGSEYVLSPVEEVSTGDQIYYIQSYERESIENYLLKLLFSEEEMSLEDILEPLTNLKIFYETLSSLNFNKDYDVTQMRKLYWLSSEEKNNLYNLLLFLFNKTLLSECKIDDVILNTIWSSITLEKLVTIFSEGNDKVTQRKLFNLALELGLRSYKESSFKVLCSKSINEQKHYSFHDDNNLLAIGKLIGHSGVIDNYYIINNKGSMVSNFLRQVGFSIKRVASGNSEAFNEIDVAIRDKLKRCVVVKREGTQ